MAAETLHCTGKRHGDDGSLQVAGPLMKKRTTGSVSSEFSNADSDSPSESDTETARPLSTPQTPLTPSSPHKGPTRHKTYECPYEDCSKTFNRPVRLDEHIRSHTNERPFHCTYHECDKTFLRQSHLTHHVKSAHTSVRGYGCDWDACDKRFLTATRLRRHQQAHEGKEKFRCTGYSPCNETFRKHGTLQRHVALKHLDRKPFPCNQIDEITGKQCVQAFDTATRLRAHQGRIHGGIRFWCLLCAVQSTEDGCEAVYESTIGFAQYTDLQTHIKEMHPPHCEHCNLVCSSSGELQKHVDIHHSGMTVDDRKTFICSEPDCGKGFTKRGNLNIHVRTVHINDKRFVCGVTGVSQSKGLEHWDGHNACQRAFGAKGTLESHILTQHLNQPHSRAETRRQKKISKQAKHSLSTFAKLTGAGYAEESGRDIACFVPSCPHLFMRQYDLYVHAQAKHGMADSEISEAVTERHALEGGPFWFGGMDEEGDGEDPELPEVDDRGNPFWSFEEPDFEIPSSASGFQDRGHFQPDRFGGARNGIDDDAIDPALILSLQNAV